MTSKATDTRCGITLARGRAGIVALLTASLSVGGCAEMTHLTRTRPLGAADGRPQATFIDAKQRAVISASRDATWEYPIDKETGGYKKAVLHPGRVRVCAEPSPDALSALAASEGLSLSKGPDLGVNQAMSLSESAASIGLRTQSIQLMRDAMYRICEGYLSGALTDGSFETLHRRLQSSMVAILAIEQLTGAVKASQVVLGGESSTGAADAVQKLTSQTAEANTARLAAENAVVTATTEQKAAQGALDDARKAKEDKPDDTAAATAVTEAEAKLDEKTKALTPAKKTLSDAEDAYKAIDEGRRAALSGTTSASSTGQMQAVSTSPALDPEAVKSVAEAVTDIVHTTLELQYSNELCTTLMVGRAYDKEVAAEKDSPVVEKCLELLQQTVDRISADTRIAVANAEAYRDRVKRLSAAELAKLPPEPKRPPPILFSN